MRRQPSTGYSACACLASKELCPATLLVKAFFLDLYQFL